MKLTREYNRLHEKERRLQEQKLEIERHRHRLFSIEHDLRNEARAKGINLPMNQEYCMLAKKISQCRLDGIGEQSSVSGLSRNESFDFGEAPGGGTLGKLHRKGSGGSSTTLRSRTQSSSSTSFRSSLEKRSETHLEIGNSKTP